MTTPAQTPRLFRQELLAMLLGQKQQFGRGGFYQSMPRLGISGQRPTDTRIRTYQLENLLCPHTDLLDIGCNCGFLSLTLAPRVRSVTGIDFNPRLIQIAQRTAEHLDLQNTSFLAAPFEQWIPGEQQWDVVLAFAVHLWVRMPFDQFAGKLLATLRPGGCLVFESHDINQNDADFDARVNHLTQQGLRLVRTGSLCDDGVHERTFAILQKPGNPPSPAADSATPFQQNLIPLANRWPDLADAIQPFGKETFASITGQAGEPFHAIRRPDGAWTPLTPPDQAAEMTDRLIQRAAAKNQAGNPLPWIFLAGLLNGSLLEKMTALAPPGTPIIVAVESPAVLAAWIALHDRTPLLENKNLTLYLFNAPENLLKHQEPLLTQFAPLIIGTHSAETTDRLAAPLLSAILHKRHLQTTWQQENSRPIIHLLKNLCDQAGRFNRADLLLRCLAIEQYRKTGNLGPLYVKMQCIRRNTRENSPLCKQLCRNFAALIDSFAANGYDRSKPITVTTDGHLVDGAHRLACAIFFQTPLLTVERGACDSRLPFGLAWFDNHFTPAEMNSLRAAKRFLQFASITELA